MSSKRWDNYLCLFQLLEFIYEGGEWDKMKSRSSRVYISLERYDWANLRRPDERDKKTRSPSQIIWDKHTHNFTLPHKIECRCWSYGACCTLKHTAHLWAFRWKLSSNDLSRSLRWGYKSLKDLTENRVMFYLNNIVCSLTFGLLAMQCLDFQNTHPCKFQ